ncbi:MAG: alpha/beta fold hydrolase [Betaproteobacteria bacterium]
MTQFIVMGYPAYAYTGGRPFESTRPTIVFVHGAAFDHTVWQWQSRYLAHHGYSVLAVDLPAHGRSPGLARTSIEAMAEWLEALVEAAGLTSVMLVGHSMGSLVTLEAARRHPERVAKLALVGTAVPMAVGPAFLAAAKDNAPEGFDMEAVWGHSRSAVLATSPVPGTYLLGASRRLNGRSRPGVLHADLAACDAYRPPAEALAQVKVPTLVVGGRRDQMTPLKAGRAVAGAIPGARFVALDAGHSMMNEAPRELLSALREFLAAG